MTGDHILIPVKHCRQCVFADFSGQTAQGRAVQSGECLHPSAGYCGVRTLRSQGLHGRCPLRMGPTIVRIAPKHLDDLQVRAGRRSRARVIKQGAP